MPCPSPTNAPTPQALQELRHPNLPPVLHVVTDASSMLMRPWLNHLYLRYFRSLATYMVLPRYPSTLDDVFLAARQRSTRAGVAAAAVARASGVTDSGEVREAAQEAAIEAGMGEHEVLLLLLQLADVIHYMTERHVTHRDVKVNSGGCRHTHTHTCTHARTHAHVVRCTRAML